MILSNRQRKHILFMKWQWQSGTTWNSHQSCKKSMITFCRQHGNGISFVALDERHETDALGKEMASKGSLPRDRDSSLHQRGGQPLQWDKTRTPSGRTARLCAVAFVTATHISGLIAPTRRINNGRKVVSTTITMATDHL